VDVHTKTATRMVTTLVTNPVSVLILIAGLHW
jgi:hypothetical protein